MAGLYNTLTGVDVSTAKAETLTGMYDWSSTGFFSSTFTSSKGAPLPDYVNSHGGKPANLFFGGGTMVDRSYRDRAGTSVYYPDGKSGSGIINGLKKLMGEYEHVKITIAERGSEARAAVSTANFSADAYSAQRNLTVTSSDPKFVSQVRQVKSWITGEGPAPKNTPNFIISGRDPETGKSLGNNSGKLQDIITGTTGDITLTSANLGEKGLVDALKVAASTGRDISIVINENREQGKGASGQAAIAQSIAREGSNVHLYFTHNKEHKGFVHANAMVAGDVAVVGDTRFNASMLNGVAASALFVEKGDASLNNNLKKWIKAQGELQANDKSFMAAASTSTGSHYSVSIDHFMPQRNGAPGTVRYQLDPNMLKGARDYALLTGEGNISVMEGAQGMGQSLYLALMADKNHNDSADKKALPWEVRAFDLGMQHRTFGQSWAWMALTGGPQIGDRGPIDSVLVRYSRRIDRATSREVVSDVDKPYTPGTLENLVTKGWDTTSNVITNTAGFYYITLPFMRGQAHLLGQLGQLARGIEKIDNVAAKAAGKFMVDTGIVYDARFKRWMGSAVEEVFMPFARLFGGSMETLTQEIADLFLGRGLNEELEAKPFGMLRYEISKPQPDITSHLHGNIDQAMQKHGLLAPLSSKGIMKPMIAFNWRLALDVSSSITRGIGAALSSLTRSSGLKAHAEALENMEWMQQYDISTRQIVKGKANPGGGIANPNALAEQFAYIKNNRLLTADEINDIEAHTQGILDKATAYNDKKGLLATRVSELKEPFKDPFRRAGMEFKSAGNSIRGAFWSSLGINKTDKFGLANLDGIVGRAAVLGLVGAVVGNQILADIGSAQRSTVLEQAAFKRVMDESGPGNRYKFGMYYTAGFSTFGESWGKATQPLGALGFVAGSAVDIGYFYAQKPLAAMYNMWTNFSENGFKDQTAGKGSYAQSILAMWSRRSDNLFQDSDLLKMNQQDRLRLISQAHNLSPDLTNLRSREMLLLAMLTGVNQRDDSVSKSQSIALQVSLLPQIMTLTLSANRLDGEERYAFTVQGPVQLGIGLGLSSPIGYKQVMLKHSGSDQQLSGRFDPESWMYEKNSTVENLAYLGIYYHGSRTIAQGVGKVFSRADSKIADIKTGIRQRMGAGADYRAATFAEEFVQTGAYKVASAGGFFLNQAATASARTGMYASMFMLQRVANPWVMGAFGLMSGLSMTQDEQHNNTLSYDLGWGVGWGAALGLGSTALGLTGIGSDWMLERALTGKGLLPSWMSGPVPHADLVLDSVEHRTQIEQIMRLPSAYDRAVEYAKVINIKNKPSISLKADVVDGKLVTNFPKAIEKQIMKQPISFKMQLQRERGELSAESQALMDSSFSYKMKKYGGRAGRAISVAFLATEFVHATGLGIWDEGQRLRGYHAASEWLTHAGGFLTLKEGEKASASNWLGRFTGRSINMVGQFIANFFSDDYRTHKDTTALPDDSSTGEYTDIQEKHQRHTANRWGSWNRLMDRMGLLKKTFYATEGNPFIGTDSFGFVFNRDADGELIWSKSYGQPAFMGVSIAYAAGLSNVRKRANVSNYMDALNATIASGNGDALHEMIRMNTKSAVIGKMFHENSGTKQLGRGGRMAMYQRTEMTRWVLADNDPYDAARYFFMDHTKRGGGLLNYKYLPSFIDMGGTMQTSASSGNARVAERFAEMFRSTRNAASKNGELAEIDWESTDYYAAQDDFFNTPRGVSGYTQHEQDFRTDGGLILSVGFSISAMLLGALATGLNLGLRGFRTTKDVTRSLLATAKEVLADKPGHMYMSSWGVNASHLGIETIGLEGSFYGGPHHAPNHRFWLHSFGNNLYTYGGAIAHVDDPFRGGRHGMRSKDPSRLLADAYRGQGVGNKREIIARYASGLEPNAYKAREVARLATEIQDIKNLDYIEHGAIKSFSTFENVVSSLDQLAPALTDVAITNQRVAFNLNNLINDLKALPEARTDAVKAARKKAIDVFTGQLEHAHNVSKNMIGVENGLVGKVNEAILSDGVNASSMKKLIKTGQEKLKDLRIEAAANPVVGGVERSDAWVNEQFNAWLDGTTDEAKALRGAMETLKGRTDIVTSIIDQPKLVAAMGYRDVSGLKLIELAGGSKVIANSYMSALANKVIGGVSNYVDELSSNTINNFLEREKALAMTSISDSRLNAAALAEGPGSAVKAAFQNMYMTQAEALGGRATDAELLSVTWRQMESMGFANDDVNAIIKAGSLELQAAAGESMHYSSRVILKYSGLWAWKAAFPPLWAVANLGMQASMASGVAQGVNSFAFGVGVAADDTRTYTDRVTAAQAGFNALGGSFTNQAIVLPLGAYAGSMVGRSFGLYKEGKTAALAAKEVYTLTKVARVVGAGIGLATEWEAGAAGAVTGAAVGTILGLGNPLAIAMGGAAGAAIGLGGRALIMGAISSFLGSYAAEAAWNAWGAPVGDAITKAAEGAGSAYIRAATAHPYLAAFNRKAASITNWTQNSFDMMSDYFIRAGKEDKASGASKLAGGVAEFLRDQIRVLSKGDSVYSFYDPEGEPGQSQSLNPQAWKLPEGYGVAFQLAKMTPLFHGSMRDASNDNLTSQDANLRSATANALVRNMFHEQMQGQVGTLGESIMTSADRTKHEASFMRSFKPLSTFSSTVNQILLVRGEATQHLLYQFLDRRDAWGNDTSKMTRKIPSSGYAEGLGLSEHSNMVSYRVRYAYQQDIMTSSQAGSVGGFNNLVQYGDTAIAMPADGPITSDFGSRMHPLRHKVIDHKGVDIGAKEGSPVRAFMAGTVSFRGYDPNGYGNFIIVDHADKTQTLYGHLSKFGKHELNQQVKAGDELGKVGHTGGATGPHLHFEERVRGIAVNPMPLINAARTGKPIRGTNGDNLPINYSIQGLKGTAQWRPLIDRAAERYGLNPVLLEAVMRQESEGENHGPNSAGAVGLMQIVPYWHDTTTTQMLNPAANIDKGASYLKYLIDRYKGNTDLALQAYNLGEGKLDRFISAHKALPHETAVYLSDPKQGRGVYHFYAQIKEERKVVKTTAIVTPKKTSSAPQDNHKGKTPKRTGLKISRVPGGVVAAATYPDGGHWQSLFDNHYQPKDNAWMFDNHAG